MRKHTRTRTHTHAHARTLDVGITRPLRRRERTFVLVGKPPASTWGAGREMALGCMKILRALASRRVAFPDPPYPPFLSNSQRHEPVTAPLYVQICIQVHLSLFLSRPLSLSRPISPFPSLSLALYLLFCAPGYAPPSGGHSPALPPSSATGEERRVSTTRPEQ